MTDKQLIREARSHRRGIIGGIGGAPVAPNEITHEQATGINSIMPSQWWTKAKRSKYMAEALIRAREIEAKRLKIKGKRR